MLHERLLAYRLEHGHEFVPLKDPVREVEDVHDPPLSRESSPMASSTLPEEDHDDVLETVVECAFKKPSPFLSEMVNSCEEESLVLLIDDVSVVCIPDPPSFKKS